MFGRRKAAAVEETRPVANEEFNGGAAGNGAAPAGSDTAVADRAPMTERDTPVADRAPVAGSDTGDTGATGGTAVAEREATRRDAPVTERGGLPAGAVARQREEFGGINWGAVFFGWLVAVGMAAILVAILSAAGAAIGLTKVSNNDVTKHAATIGIGGGIALLVILVLAYYSGGYVAGRMSRFDGGRQGFGVWVFGFVITLLFAAAGAILGSKYNVLNSLNLPRIPIKEGSLATGGAIALAAILIGSLLAALAGGAAGRRYHRRVDAVAYEA